MHQEIVAMVTPDQNEYFEDDGTGFNPDLRPAPDLCATCTKASDPSQTLICNLTRADQSGKDIFVCFAYDPISPKINRKQVLRALCEQAGIEYTEEDLEPGTDNDDGIPF